MKFFRRSSAVVLHMLALAGVAWGPLSAAHAQQSQPDAPAAPANAETTGSADHEKGHYLRVVEIKGKSVALEIATRNFVPRDGAGPVVGLVAVAHIGDRGFYRALEKLLAEYEVVLYESVKPSGAGGARGENDQRRADSTREAIRFLAGMIEAYQQEESKYPADLQVVRAYAAAKDSRLAAFIEAAAVDAWGRRMLYQLNDESASRRYTLMSLGSDGKAGGEGADADIALDAASTPEPFTLNHDDGLQAQLAEALGLEFQLEAISYDQPNWRCSDMAMDELNRRLEAKGLDFSMVGGTLAGSSMPARIIKIFLAFMKMADTFMEGAIADTFKVIMIEMLGDPAIIDQSLAQFSKGFAEVIVEDRNQVAIDDLKALLESEQEVKSVAILYGAAHMPDLAQRLVEQLDYCPAPAPASGEAAPQHATDVRWLCAIKVDFTKSKMSAADLNYIRSMIKQAMRQQMRRR